MQDVQKCIRVQIHDQYGNHLLIVKIRNGFHHGKDLFRSGDSLHIKKQVVLKSKPYRLASVL